MLGLCFVALPCNSEDKLNGLIEVESARFSFSNRKTKQIVEISNVIDITYTFKKHKLLLSYITLPGPKEFVLGTITTKRSRGFHSFVLVLRVRHTH